MVPCDGRVIVDVTDADGEVVAHEEFPMPIDIVRPPNPQVLARQQMMRDITAAYGMLDGETPQWDEAQEAFEAIVEAHPDEPDPYYHLACWFGRRSLQVEDTEEREALQVRAVQLLGQAADRGWANAAHMASDPDMEPLRTREDYGKVLERIEENASGG